MHECISAEVHKRSIYDNQNIRDVFEYAMPAYAGMTTIYVGNENYARGNRNRLVYS